MHPLAQHATSPKITNAHTTLALLVLDPDAPPGEIAKANNFTLSELASRVENPAVQAEIDAHNRILKTRSKALSTTLRMDTLRNLARIAAHEPSHPNDPALEARERETARKANTFLAQLIFPHLKRRTASPRSPGGTGVSPAYADNAPPAGPVYGPDRLRGCVITLPDKGQHQDTGADERADAATPEPSEAQLAQTPFVDELQELMSDEQDEYLDDTIEDEPQLQSLLERLQTALDPENLTPEAVTQAIKEAASQDTS